MISRGAVVAFLVFATGCRFHGIDLVEDTRLAIISPANRATVSLPLVVRWTVRDIPRGERRFLVIVDGSPPPPGDGLDWFARNDDFCRATPGCPDERYLANNHIYITTDARLAIPALAPQENLPWSRRNRHDVTVVLIDESGRRIGENSAFVEFTVRAR